MFTLNPRFLLFTVILLIVEIFIASFVHDSIIRPYIGDYLVVILIYCFVRTFIKTSPLKAAIGVLLFSYFIEVLQYFNFLKLTGLENNKIAKTVLGYGFDWIDLLMYMLGIATVLLLSRKKN